MAPDVGVPPDGVTRLLLVEDDEGDAFLVRELLDETMPGAELVWSRTIAQARAELARQAFRCVLIDLGLPDASGLEALRSVLDGATGTAVIVLTGLDEDSSGLAAVAAGAQDYLVKGQVDGQLLRRAIRYAVERKAADAQLLRLYASELREAENTRLEWGLLPLPLVADPRLAVHTRYRTGRGGVLGGDFFDVVETPDGSLHVVLGDVAGHGPDEAALGVALRIAWRTLVLSDIPVDQQLPCLARVLERERRTDEAFATVCSLVVAPDRRSLRMSLAGHPSPVLLSGEPGQLPDDVVGPAVAMFPDVSWDSRTVELDPCWRLMLFSDGLVEARLDGGPERVGVERMVQIARDSPSYDETPALMDHLIEAARELNGEELSDDVAVLVVECAGP